MAWVYFENSHTPDHILDSPNPSASVHFQSLGPAVTRLILQYEANEQNRNLMESWETYQLLLGAFFFFFLLFGTREDKFSLLIALIMVILSLVQRLLITPELVSVGRLSDFVPAGGYFPGRPQLPVIQSAHSAVELTKGVVGLLLGARMIFGRRRRSDEEVRQELDLINKANYRHVDR